MKLVIVTFTITAAAVGGTFSKLDGANDDIGPEHRKLQTDLLTLIPTLSPSFYPTYYINNADTDPVSSLRPSRNPTARPTMPCTRSFTVAMYDSIEEDIATLTRDIEDEEDRTHFLGGIVRLAAHDFMDFDPSSFAPMGSDGCFDPDHPRNAGLDDIWCDDDCPLTLLHRTKYSHISRADFWVVCANAVIYQTSVDNALDMRDTFRWGRKDRDSCIGSGQRLPRPSGCQQIEAVFLRKMGLSWREAVALLGAHTLGRGDRDFSGHHGTWKDSNEDAQVFDKQYFVELSTNAWRMRNVGGPDNGGAPQDWTTGRSGDQMMLNTDVCLLYDIDENVDTGTPCCAVTDSTFPEGENQCIEQEAASRRCSRYSQNDSRGAARRAVIEYGDGDDNSNFYSAFREAWTKATTLGHSNLSPLEWPCDSEYW